MQDCKLSKGSHMPRRVVLHPPHQVNERENRQARMQICLIRHDALCRSPLEHHCRNLIQHKQHEALAWMHCFPSAQRFVLMSTEPRAVAKLQEDTSGSSGS